VSLVSARSGSFQTDNLLKMFAGPDLITITLGLIKRYYTTNGWNPGFLSFRP